MAVSIPRSYEVIIYQQNDNKPWGTQSQAETNSVNIIRGWLPEEFSYSAASNYEAPFHQAATEGTTSALLGAMGFKLMTPLLTGQIWTGAEIPEFNITLQFEAETDAWKDVGKPVMDLIKMVTPMVDESSLLKSPGPYIDPTAILGGLVNTAKNSKGWENIKNATGSVTAAGANAIMEAGKIVFGSTLNTEKAIANDKSALERKYWTDASKDSTTRVKNQISMAIGRFLYFPSVVITNVSSNYVSQIHAGTGLPMSAEVEVQFRPLFIPTQDDLQTMFSMGK